MKPTHSFLTLAFLFCVACGGDSAEPGDCAEAYCPFIGNWSLNELYEDGDPSDDDYSAYKLNLKQPESGDSYGEYQRTFSTGVSETGYWTLLNNNDVLELSNDSGVEEYIVESVGGNTLVLIIERMPIKPGPNEYRMVFGK